LQESTPKFVDHKQKEQASQRLLWSFGVAFSALGLGVLLLISAYSLLSPDARMYRADSYDGATGPRVIEANSLVARIGRAEFDGDNGLALTRLSGDRAILTQRLDLQAQDYAFLQYRLTARNPGQRIYLIWKSAESPAEIFSLPLNWSGDNNTTVSLVDNPDWSGTITEIGLDVYGELRNQSLVISDLSLLPGSATGLLSAVWSQWTTFRGWSQKSINHLGDPESTLPTPAEAAAAWAALALALALLLRLMAPRRGQPMVILGSAILVPWLAFDILWQRELNIQHSETRYLFSGKAMHERHLADEDSEIYSYAKRLKTASLPDYPSRVFILHDSEEHDFERLKTQYYLLPHNIYNYGRLPDKDAVKTGDFILMLGKIPGLEYSENSKTLRWGNDQQLTVTLLDTDERGLLFVIAPALGTGSARTTPLAN
jgi:hypothetical protein